jgi:serine/threonine-protein kinase
MPSFLAELKRRRVVRVALVYGAVAFAVVQAADVFVPALGLPGWILTAVALLAILGFPVAVVLAWAYDIHPEAGASYAAPGPGSGPGAGVSSASAEASPPDAEPGTGGSELSGGTAPPESPPRPRTRQEPAWLGVRTLVAVAGLVLLGLAFGAGWLIPSGAASLSGGAEGEAPPPSPWITRMPLAIDAASLRGPPSLSDDGRRLAWTAPDGIHLRSFDQIADRVLPGTSGASVAFFSPDGRDLGYRLDGELHVTGLEGEADRVLLDSAVVEIPMWSGDGWIYALSGASRALLRVREDGDPVETVFEADSTRVFNPTASISGGRWILGEVVDPRRVEATDAEDRPDPVIGALDPVDGETRHLLDGRLPRYEPLTGHLVFLRGETLMAVAFDPDRVEVDGVPFVVADDVGSFGLAADGTLWYVEGAIGRSYPVVVERSGEPREISLDLSDREVFVNAYFSPEGDRLVLSIGDEETDQLDLWVHALPDGPRTRLTYEGARFPAWSLDGRHVLFARDDGVYRVRADAASPPERVVVAEGIGWLQPTPGGEIVFEHRVGADFNVGVVSPGSEEIRLLVEGPANEEDPDVSSDGRWLAYESDETGNREVYVTPFREVGRGQRISVAGGNNPLWSRSDPTLFFRNGQDELERVRIGQGPELEVLERSVLFDVTGLGGRFQPAPGDSLFMAKDATGPGADAQVILVRNWARELAARAESADERRGARP